MRLVAARTLDVCFLHVPVDPDVVETRLPHPLAVATRDGTAWVSLLGMRTRPLAGALPLPGAFAQITVRTYVRAGGVPAVYFLRIDVDSRPVSVLGRRLFDLPYRTVDASHGRDPGGIAVRTSTPAGEPVFDGTFEPEGEPTPVEPDSLVGWLTDRRVYALDDGRTGAVEHDPWHLGTAGADLRTDELLASEGLGDRVGDPVVRYSPGADFRLTEWPSEPRSQGRRNPSSR